ncbi:MAG: hypothetical protein JWM87_2659 [Candidatus Eremiobacteraeota bacterium]|nr:hypothetical protein [Candidatus Eremiobacteraeota bacterium]
MNCPGCGVDTNSQFCPHCGTAVPYAAGPNLSKGPQPTGAPGAPGVTTAVADSEVRNWAMACHLAALSGLVVPVGNLIGPLVVWLLKKDQSPLIDREGKESLNFQISMTIYMFISALLIFVLIGIPLLLVVAVLDLIFTIVAATKVSSGIPYRYPLTIRFLR